MDERELKRLLDESSSETRRHFDEAVGRVEADCAATRLHFDETKHRR